MEYMEAFVAMVSGIVFIFPKVIGFAFILFLGSG